MTPRRGGGDLREANPLGAVTCEGRKQSDSETGLGQAAMQCRVVGAMDNARPEAGSSAGPLEDQRELRARHAGDPRLLAQRRQVDGLARPVAVREDEQKRLGQERMAFEPTRGCRSQRRE
jgi:hypothetical protein